MNDRIVLLYYKYVEIKNPAEFVREHLAFCKQNNLKGRVLISAEGINGTLAGTTADTEAYKAMMSADPRFFDMEFKEGFGDEYAFNKMKVKLRKEIVASDFDVNVFETGNHLSPEEFEEMLKDPDAVAVDMRNDYEYKIGRFKNAINLEMDTFRDLPKVVGKIEDLKEKKILAYCTGGIRCEKATAYLKKVGFKNVYQLHGGIIKYGEKLPDKSYEGTCFVFDNRMSVAVNKEKDVVISDCTYCETKTDVFINCSNAECNKLFLCCEKCGETREYACSDLCREKRRDFDQKEYLQLIKQRYATAVAK